MHEKLSKKEIMILNLLKAVKRKISSPEILSYLKTEELDISERTIRYYLEQLHDKGFVTKTGKKGFVITEKGINEIMAGSVISRVGFLSSKILSKSFQMTFDPDKCEGTVIVNVSIVEPDKILSFLNLFKEVFRRNFAMGEKVCLFLPHEYIGDFQIPERMIGIGTICSVTLNGVLLKKGVPVASRFGGILQIESENPLGFVEIIMYDSTTMDPLEIFIRSGMTDYLGVLKKNSGRIGAGFREVPVETLDIVKDVCKKMKKIGIGTYPFIGAPGKPVFHIPVNEGSVGLIVMGGLNPVAVFEESGIKVKSSALAGFVEYSKLFHYSEIDTKIKKILNHL